MAILTGRRNLSLATGASQEMTDLIKTCIKYGIENHASQLDALYKGTSADTIRKYMIASSIDINKIQIDKFASLKFVGVSVDEGSQMKVHNLDFVLENPLSDVNPYPIFTSVMNGGSAEEYAEHLARGINIIKMAKINICSITVDGNRAQLKALSFEWDGSIRKRYIDNGDFIKKIMLNHCLCHKINN